MFITAIAVYYRVQSRPQGAWGQRVTVHARLNAGCMATIIINNILHHKYHTHS